MSESILKDKINFSTATLSPKAHVQAELNPVELNPSDVNADSMNDSKKFIIAIIPAHNEDRFIGSLVLKTQKYVDLVIVVDDGSADDTTTVAHEAGAEVIAHQINKGKAEALNTGFSRAREYDADIVVILDGDGQHDPQEIPGMIEPIVEDKVDIVIGSRFQETKSEIPVWRQAGQHTLTIMTNLASGVNSSDSQSGFRAFSRKALADLQIESNGFAIESEMQFWVREKKLRVQEASISCLYDEPAKRNPVKQAMQVMNGIITLVSLSRPLYFFGIIGTTSTLIGITGWWICLNIQQTTGQLPQGYLLFATLFILLGMLSIFEGITLHTMRSITRRLYERVERRTLRQEVLNPTVTYKAKPQEIVTQEA